MTLPAWWQVVTPHKDIRENRFSEAVFAADLGDVVRGNAPEDYLDPRLFFNRTYLTAGLKNLAENILTRLSGNGGDAVIQLQTPFGGGKTHSLLALYHLVNSYSEVSHLEMVKEIVSNVPGFKSARGNVACFVGTAADAVRGRTPWGEVAYQLGFYNILEDHDKKRVAPGKERLREMLEKSGPTLILMDEILEYIVKANRNEKEEKATQGQTLAFLQELSEVVSALDKCNLVVTLPASIMEQYDEEAEKALRMLQRVTGRVESIYEPVEGVEIYEIIRKRLIEDLGDDGTRKQVAEFYYNLYQQLGNDAPNEVRDIEYREKIERSYPFHPELIDVLYEKWGSLTSFQRTRGVLRLLAMVISDLYVGKNNSPLIHSSQVNMGLSELRREFIKHTGNEYDSIITSDITGKASRIDREMGSEYEKYGLAQGLATSIFLHSFSGSERRGVSLAWLKVSLLREGIPNSIVADALGKLEDSLWYVHVSNKVYAFKNRPNLNRIIMEKEENMEDELLIDAFRERLKEQVKGSPVAVYLWPDQPAHVTDNKRIKIVLMGPDYPRGYEETDNLAREMIMKCGATNRIFRNTMFIAAIDENIYANYQKKERSYQAIQLILDDSSVFLPEEDRNDLNRRMKQLDKEIPDLVTSCYSHVGWHMNSGVVWRDMGMMVATERPSMAERIYRFLKDEERILSVMTVGLIFNKTFAEDEEEKQLSEIFDVFFKTPGLPCLESEQVLCEAVRHGAKAGLLGVRQDYKLYFQEEPFQVNLEAIAVRPEKAQEELTKQEEAKKKATQEGKHVGTTSTGGSVSVSDGTSGSANGTGNTGDQQTLDEKSEGKHQVKYVSFRVALPWDKLSHIINGVILPLKNAGSEPMITLEVHASSESGFDRTTLDSKVRETLQQLGANVVEWEEK